MRPTRSRATEFAIKRISRPRARRERTPISTAAHLAFAVRAGQRQFDPRRLTSVRRMTGEDDLKRVQRILGKTTDGRRVIQPSHYFTNGLIHRAAGIGRRL